MFHNYTITIYNIGYNYIIAIYLYSRFSPLNSQIGAWPKISASTTLSFNKFMESDQEYLDHAVQSKIAVVIIK